MIFSVPTDYIEREGQQQVLRPIFDGIRDGVRELVGKRTRPCWENGLSVTSHWLRSRFVILVSLANASLLRLRCLVFPPYVQNLAAS